MSIRDDIGTALKAAMKARKQLTMDVLRSIKSEVRNREVAKSASNELDDDGILDVISSAVKKRKESAKVYAENDRPELAEKELAEIEVLAGFLPEPLSEDEIKKAVTGKIAELGATEMKQMGQVMKEVTAALGKAADGSTISRFVKEALSS